MIRVFCLFLFLFLFNFTILISQEIKIVTEIWEPYNYIENGEEKGLGVEIVKELLKETKTNAKIEFLPWNRAYNMATTEPNVMIFTMTRNKERENLFKWVGKVANREIWVFKMKERKDIDIKSIDDMKKYKIGCPSLNDSITQYFLKLNFEKDKNLDITEGDNAEEMVIKKFFSKRVDILPINEIAFNYQMKKLGYDPKNVDKIFLLTGKDEAGYFIAFSSKTSDDVYNKFKNAYDNLVKNGTYQKILNKYILSK